MVANSQAPLFRQQALASQSNEMLGKVMVVPSFSVLLVIGVLIVWLTSAALWLVHGEYTRQVNALGWIEPEQGVTHHFANHNKGTVKTIFVKPGEWVEKGQIMMRINVGNYTADGTPVTQLITDQLYWQIADIQDQIEGEKRQYQTLVEHKRQQLQQTKLDLAHLAKIELALNNKNQLAIANVKKLTKLAGKGWVSEMDLNQAEQIKLDAAAQVIQVERERIQLTKQINTLKRELNLIPQQEANDIGALEHKLSELKQRRIQLTASQEDTIIASTAGWVSDVFVKAGQSLDVSKPLLTLIPNDNKMIANIVLPVRAAGFVEPGQSLQLRYDAFPHEKFGLFEGTIQSVSDSILLPSQVNNLSVAINEPVYMVRAELAKNTVSAYGKQIEIKAGMTLSAHISTGERSLLEWLFEPLLSLQGTV